MTDQEYAAIIYRKIFLVTDDNDAPTQGIMKAISTLGPREQFVLEKYYRHGKTLEQVGKEIGLSRSWVGQIVNKAILKLRHPLRSRDIILNPAYM